VKNLTSIFVLIALILVFYATAIQPSADTYWHLAVGRQVFQQKTIPRVDKFIYGPKDVSFNSVEWLSALLTYLAVKTWGLTAGLVLTRLLIAAVTLIFLILSLALFTKNSRLIIALSLLTAYALSIRFNDRPEIFSYASVSFTLYCSLHLLINKKLTNLSFALPLVFLAWPNIHPFAAVGLLILLFFTVLFLLETLIDKSSGLLKERLKISIVSTASLIFCLLQLPKFLIFLEGKKLASSNLIEFGNIKQLLINSQGFDFFNQIPIDIYIYFFYLLLSLMLLAIFIAKKNYNWQLGLILAFSLIILTLPLRFFRLAPLVILITTPPLAFLLPKIFSNNLLGQYKKVIIIAVNLFFIILILGSILQKNIIGIREDTFVITQSNGQNLGKPVSVVNRWWTSEFPTKAPEIINNFLKSKRVFTSATWNNYLLWYSPQIQVFADALFYNRGEEDYQDEKKLTEASENWQQLLDKYKIDTVILSQPYVRSFVYTPVYQLANWQLIYVDEIAAIYARDDIIKGKPLDLSLIKPQITDPLKYREEDKNIAVKQLEVLLNFSPENAFAREQLILSFKQTDIQKAKQLAQESRILLPNDPIFSMELAKIYFEQNQCQFAKSFAEEALVKSFHHFLIKLELEPIFNKCQS